MSKQIPKREIINYNVKSFKRLYRFMYVIIISSLAGLITQFTYCMTI
jgi:hypothetical protein